MTVQPLSQRRPGWPPLSPENRRCYISRAVHPEARAILTTQAKGLGLEVKEIPCHDGVTDLEELEAASDVDTAAVILQSPNFFGNLEDLSPGGTDRPPA